MDEELNKMVKSNDEFAEAFFDMVILKDKGYTFIDEDGNEIFIEYDLKLLKRALDRSIENEWYEVAGIYKRLIDKMEKKINKKDGKNKN